MKVASVEVKCPTEKIAETDAQVTFPETGSDGDCMDVAGNFEIHARHGFNSIAFSDNVYVVKSSSFTHVLFEVVHCCTMLVASVFVANTWLP